MRPTTPAPDERLLQFLAVMGDLSRDSGDDRQGEA